MSRLMIGVHTRIEELNYGHLNTFPQFAYDSKAFPSFSNTIADLKNDPHLEQLRLHNFFLQASSRGKFDDC